MFNLENSYLLYPYCKEEVEQVIKKNLDRSEDERNFRDRSKHVRNTTNVDLKTNKKYSENALKDRIYDEESIKRPLEDVKEELCREIGNLTSDKDKCEKPMKDLYKLYAIIMNCLRIRNGKSFDRYTDDIIDMNLKNELDIINKYQKIILDYSAMLYVKCFKLKDLLKDVSYDLEKKKEALIIDEEQSEMYGESVKGASLKVDPFKIPEGAISMDTWLNNFDVLVQKCDAEVKRCREVRKNQVETVDKVWDELYPQVIITNGALRACVYNFECAKRALEITKDDIDASVVKLNEELKELEAKKSKLNTRRKVVETKLENRKYRPVTELVEDEAQFRFRDELLHLFNSSRNIDTKINLTKSYLHDHEIAMNNVLSQIDGINNAIEINKAVIKVRDDIWKIMKK